MYFNWYVPYTGAVTRTWPLDGSRVTPFLSSVDNAWLAASLWLVCRRCRAWPIPRSRCSAQMDFRWHYDAAVGFLRGGFWTSRPDVPCVADGRAAVFYTPHHYSVLNSETRIASYVGIALGQLEPSHYFRLWRVPPDSSPPEWRRRAYRTGVRDAAWRAVTEGCYRFRDIALVPSWGGGMFEALMVPMLVPEARWGTGSWAVNHRRYVDAQIRYCMRDAAYGYWGLSPCTDPAGGYREYGRPRHRDSGRVGPAPGPGRSAPSSPRTPRSWRSTTVHGRLSKTSPGCAATSSCTGPGGYLRLRQRAHRRGVGALPDSRSVDDPRCDRQRPASERPATLLRSRRLAGVDPPAAEDGAVPPGVIASRARRAPPPSCRAWTTGRTVTAWPIGSASCSNRARRSGWRPVPSTGPVGTAAPGSGEDVLVHRQLQSGEGQSSYP